MSIVLEATGAGDPVRYSAWSESATLKPLVVKSQWRMELNVIAHGRKQGKMAVCMSVRNGKETRDQDRTLDERRVVEMLSLRRLRSNQTAGM